MKTALIFFLVGGIVGAVAMHVYSQRQAERGIAQPQPADPAPTAQNPPPNNPLPADQNTGNSWGDAISHKLTEWHLTPDDIKNDLAKTGEIVRTKTQALGERMDDGRIVAVIKAKYVLDRDLSAIDISVDSHDGQVVLGGTVTSPGLIGKAIVLALDTHGVHGVTSKISVAQKQPA